VQKASRASENFFIGLSQVIHIFVWGSRRWSVGADFFADIPDPLLFPPYQGGIKGGVRQSAPEVPKAFGAKNEPQYSTSGGDAKKLYGDSRGLTWYFNKLCGLKVQEKAGSPISS
jgi:hypothetical protein